MSKSGIRELTKKELEQVSGGAGNGWTSTNPGGQSEGASQTTYNGGGNAPGGQNKNLPAGLQ